MLVARIIVFIALAYGGAWALLTPALLSSADLADPVGSPGAYLATVAMMFTPAASALLVAVALERHRGRSVLRGVGLDAFFTRRGWRIGLWATAASAALVVGSWALGLCFGWLEMDPERSPLKTLFVQLTGEEPPLPMAALAVLQLVNLPVGLAVTSVAVAGEEVGWRGWLLPRLVELAPRWALPLSGLIWGVWHTPAILLGLNYDQRDLLGVCMMTVACTGVGVLIGWLRLHSRSLLPCVLAHAGLNVFTTYQSALFPPFDQRLVGPLSVTGWIVIAAMLVWLGVARRRQGGAFGRGTSEPPTPSCSVPDRRLDV
ncbi:CPBP family intramembrane glutamic endopeptidase [Curtobacterium sp. 24E2]|nr:CPBP family intramembrane metalloprotease [Curtobacterium sp. 24E2]